MGRTPANRMEATKHAKAAASRFQRFGGVGTPMAERIAKTNAKTRRIVDMVHLNNAIGC
jgi:hypothetical protein